MYRVYFILMASLVIASCNPNDERLFKNGSGSSESKPVSSKLGSLSSISEQMNESRAVTSVNYDLKVSTTSGAVLCRGTATLEIMSDFQLKFPEAKIQCASLTIDLAAALASQSSGVDLKNASHDGKIFSLKSIGGAEFNPPRPFLLGPIVQDSSKYAGLKQTTAHSISGIDPNTNQPYSSQGNISIEVLNHHTTYSNNMVGESFNNILHWEMRTSGFNLATKYGLLFDRMEWLWNTNPIMIPKLVIVGKMSDFISGGQADIATMMTGILEISLSVREYKVL